METTAAGEPVPASGPHQGGAPARAVREHPPLPRRHGRIGRLLVTLYLSVQGGYRFPRARSLGGQEVKTGLRVSANAGEVRLVLERLGRTRDESRAPAARHSPTTSSWTWARCSARAAPSPCPSRYRARSTSSSTRREWRTWCARWRPARARARRVRERHVSPWGQAQGAACVESLTALSSAAAAACSSRARRGASLDAASPHHRAAVAPRGGETSTRPFRRTARRPC